jgi:hypothetical protein
VATVPDRSTTPTAEAFTAAVKACRDVLVDDVERHLGGVPIPGVANVRCGQS